MVSQLSEQLKDNFYGLEQALSDMKTIWDTITTLFDDRPHGQTLNGVTTTLTLSDQASHVSALIDFSVSHDPRTTQLRSTARVALGNLGISTTDRSCQHDEAMHRIGSRRCVSLNYVATPIQVCELLLFRLADPGLSRNFKPNGLRGKVHLVVAVR